MLILEIYNLYIKYALIIIFYTNAIFLDNIYININKKEFIEIDNEFKINSYEKDITFKYNSTKLKPIALYHPEYNKKSYYKYFNKTRGYSKLNGKNIESLIKAQINLARNHQIYGFAIYFKLINTDYYTKSTLDVFINKLDFPFFIIWKNDEYKILNKYIIDEFIKNIKNYIKSKNYIKIQNKPVLSIDNPNKMKNRINVINLLRRELNEKIGEFFIIYPFRGNFTKGNFYENFDGIYDYSVLDLYKEITNRPNILYYSGYIYKNLKINQLDYNFTIYRSCYINNKFKDYKPEKFYMINKIIFNWQNIEKNNIENFIFINSWNDYKNGNYLEYDEKYGYASINSFTKSILNMTYENKDYYLDFDNKNITIAIQIHVFYEEILPRIINKINNIPFKYDLYISTISKEKKEIIETYLKELDVNKYEIKIYENKGRDVYPFIRQMRTKYKKYKYICHLHTKKSTHKKLLGFNWSVYLYNNLIGDKNIIKDILYDFERYDKLGFIFPEAYYEITKGIKDFEDSRLSLHAINNNYMNYILKRIFHKNMVVGDKLVFPLGDMFWAKTKAIYQIFNVRLKYPEELGQTNETIMHAIERLWLYLVKLNGYYYKSTLIYY